MAETNAASAVHDHDDDDFQIGDAGALSTHEDICSSTHNMDVPNVKRVEYSVIDIDNDGYVSLMDDSSDTHSDIKLLEGDLGQEIRSKYENGDGVKVTALQPLGEEAIITCKIENDSRK